jgi:hypothetical protein
MQITIEISYYALKRDEFWRGSRANRTSRIAAWIIP